MSKYIAEIGGSSRAQGPVSTFETIRAARAWAEEYGNTADYCTITDKLGRVVGRHIRDRNGSGLRWFRAVVEA